MSPRERALVHALRVAVDALEAHLEARSDARPRVVYAASNDDAVPTELDRALARGILARVGGVR